jgi:hypothetical protein
MRIEAAKEAIRYLPMTASVLASLRETARNILSRWVEGGLLAVVDAAKKSRKYGLAK